MVLTENGKPGSDNLAFTRLAPTDYQKAISAGSLNTSGGSSTVSNIPEDGSIILGEKAQKGNRYHFSMQVTILKLELSVVCSIHADKRLTNTNETFSLIMLNSSATFSRCSYCTCRYVTRFSVNRDLQKLQLSNTEVIRRACCPCSLPEKRTTCLRTVWQVGGPSVCLSVWLLVFNRTKWKLKVSKCNAVLVGAATSTYFQVIKKQILLPNYG